MAVVILSHLLRKTKLRTFQAIDSGKVQGGLKTCAGEKLPDTKVLMCSEVVDAVNEAGDIKVIKDTWCIKV